MSLNIHRKIIAVLTPQEKRKFYSAIVLEVSVALLDLVFLAALLFLVNQFISPSPNVWFNDQLLQKHPLLFFGIFCLGYALKNGFAYYVLSRQQAFFYSVATRLSEDRLRAYLQSDYEDYVHTDSSVYNRQIGQQPIEFAHYVLRGLHQVIGQAILVALAVLAILIYDASLFLMLFLFLSLPLAITAWWLKKKLSHARTEIRQSSESSLQHLQESLAGFIESKIFSKKEFFIRRYIGYQKKLNHNLAGQQTIQALPSRLIELFALAGFFLLLNFTVYQQNGAIPFITLGAFLAAAYKIIPGMVKMLNGIGQIRTYEFVLNDLPMASTDHSTKDTVRNGMLSIESLDFDRVGFSYGEKTVFNNLSFSLRKGEITGISGYSGRGKTTLIHLLLGFLAPLKGEILFNGKNMGSLTKERIWEKISYARQQPFFIHDSVYQNVVMGDEGIDEERFMEAAEATGFYSISNGNTSKTIRENGRNISGGQRQRIALARALYKDADLLILDEPFSELDGSSVNEILRKLKALAERGKMILLITHDASVLSQCSKIIHLENC